MRDAPPGSACPAEPRRAGRLRPPPGLVLAVLAAHGAALLAWAVWAPAPAGPALQRFELPALGVVTLAAAPPARPAARPPHPPLRPPRPVRPAAAPPPRPASAPADAAAAASASAPAPEPDPVQAAASLPPPEPPLPPPAADRLPAPDEGFLAGPASAAGAPPASAPAAAPDPEPSPEPAWAAAWPDAIELRYRVHGEVRGEVHGEAAVRWLRQGGRYQVQLDLLIGPRFAPLLVRRSTSEGRLGPEGLQPERYEERSKLPLVAERRAQLRFEPGQITLANGRVEAAPPGVQDPASQFVQLAWRLAQGDAGWQAGQRLDMPLAMTRRVETWGFELAARVTLPTPMGELPAWHVRPRRPGRTGAYAMEAWMAPALRGLPVRIRIADDKGQRLELELDAVPREALDPAALARAASAPPAPRWVEPAAPPALPPGFQP